MKGTKVKHRADPTGREMIVISETVVAAAWIEGGEARSDHFEPEELEVVGTGERLRGVGFDHAWIAGDADPPPAEGIGQCVECEKSFLVRPDPLYGTFECPLCGASYQVDSRSETGYRHVPPLGLRQTTLAAAGWNELGPLCKRCSNAPAEGNPCTESRGAEKVIGDDGVRRCAAFDLADAEIDPCSSCAHHRPDEGIMCSADQEPTIGSRGCDRFVAPSSHRGSKAPDDPKPSDADLADAIDSALCLACDHWPADQGQPGEDFVACGANRLSTGPEDSCEKWARIDLDYAIDNRRCLACDSFPACTKGKLTNGPEDSCGDWVRTEPPAEDHRAPPELSDRMTWHRLDHILADRCDAAVCGGCSHDPIDCGYGWCGFSGWRWFFDGMLVACEGRTITDTPPEDHEPQVGSAIKSFGELALADELESRGWAVCGPGDDVPEQIDALGSRITTIREELLRRADANELAAELTRRGMVVVTPADLPKPHCYVCEHWGSDQPDPCLKSMLHDIADVDKGPCDDYEQRWEDIAKHLSKQVAGGDLKENPHLDPDVRRELDETPPTDTGTNCHQCTHFRRGVAPEDSCAAGADTAWREACDHWKAIGQVLGPQCAVCEHIKLDEESRWACSAGRNIVTTPECEGFSSATASAEPGILTVALPYVERLVSAANSAVYGWSNDPSELELCQEEVSVEIDAAAAGLRVALVNHTPGQSEAHPPAGLVAILRESATERVAKQELLLRLTGVTAIACNSCRWSAAKGDCDLTPPSEGGRCSQHEPTWRHVAEALAGWIEAQHGEAGEADDAPPPADRYPCPSLEIKSATLGEQLAWLREHELPTPTGTGKADRTSRVLRALLAGIYTEEHADLLFGPLKWPVKPEPARCPECGSETPEDCEHELP